MLKCVRVCTALSGLYHSVYYFISSPSVPETVCLKVELEFNLYGHKWTCIWVGALTNWASQADKLCIGTFVFIRSNFPLYLRVQNSWYCIAICSSILSCCDMCAPQVHNISYVSVSWSSSQWLFTCCLPSWRMYRYSNAMLDQNADPIHVSRLRPYPYPWKAAVI
jgi:hypothetical protein